MTDQPEDKEKEKWKPAKRKKMTNKTVPQLYDKRTNIRPPSPIKGKSLLVENNDAKSKKNRYDSLENLEE